MDDVVQRGITVTQRRASSMWPPPPVQVSRRAGGRRQRSATGADGRRRRPTRAARLYAAGLAAVVFLALATPRAAELPAEHFTVFVLAVVVGYYVISNVAPRAAHAADERDQRDLRDHPGRRHPAGRRATTSRSQCSPVVAILVASINIFGGFLVTRRMLEMFQEGLSQWTS